DRHGRDHALHVPRLPPRPRRRSVRNAAHAALLVGCRARVVRVCGRRHLWSTTLNAGDTDEPKKKKKKPEEDQTAGADRKPPAKTGNSAPPPGHASHRRPSGPPRGHSGGRPSN